MDAKTRIAGQANRFRGAVARRLRAAALRWAVRDPARAAERAIDWLIAAERDGGLPTRMGGALACPATTAAGVLVMARWGQRELANRWAERLLAWQNTEGALPDAIGRGVSLRNTALALRAFLATARVLRPAASSAAAIERWEQGACRAADCLARHFDGCRAEQNLSTATIESYAPPAARLVDVAALARAADHFQQPDWQATAQRAKRALLRTSPLVATSLGWHAPHIAEALLELDSPELARAVMAASTGHPRSDGLMLDEAGQVSAPHALQLARLWLSFGETARADRLLAELSRRQTAGGGFPGSWGRSAAYFPRAEATGSALEFLACLAQRVRSQFAGDAPEVARVAMADEPVGAVLRSWAAEFQPGDVVAEIGAGRGRWLPALQTAAPRATWLAIDAAPALLSPQGQNWIALEGDLLDLPLASVNLAGALMVETLEHALLPRHAIAEMCRVVRPGGKLLIVDKPRQRQALSDHAPWERWFEPAEVSALLSSWCADIRCVAVPGSRPGAEMLCWTARRKIDAIAPALEFHRRRDVPSLPLRAAA